MSKLLCERVCVCVCVGLRADGLNVGPAYLCWHKGHKFTDAEVTKRQEPRENEEKDGL